MGVPRMLDGTGEAPCMNEARRANWPSSQERMALWGPWALLCCSNHGSHGMAPAWRDIRPQAGLLAGPVWAATVSCCGSCVLQQTTKTLLGTHRSRHRWVREKRARVASAPTPALLNCEEPGKAAPRKEKKKKKPRQPPLGVVGYQRTSRGRFWLRPGPPTTSTSHRNKRPWNDRQLRWGGGGIFSGAFRVQRGSPLAVLQVCGHSRERHSRGGAASRGGSASVS